MSDDFGYTSVFKKDGPIIVKIVWLLLLCFLLACFGLYAKEGFTKYHIDPDKSITNDIIPSREIPFPALTVCPPLLIKSKFLNVSRHYSLHRMRFGGKEPKATSTERDFLEAFMHACLDHNTNDFNSDLDLSVIEGNEQKFKEAKIVQFLNQGSPQLHEALFSCEVNRLDNCEAMFIRALTGNGYCFTFNLLGYHSLFRENISHDFDSYKRKRIPISWEAGSPYRFKYHNDEINQTPSEWNLQYGYSTDKLNVQPLRATRSRFTLITSIQNTDIPNLCEGRRQGYKVFLHLPNEIPSIFHTENYFQLKGSMTMSITADVVKYDDTLRKLTPEKRGCYFNEERQLKFFKSYTQRNCEYECMTNYTLKACGCVKFSMPRNTTTKVCGHSDLKCYPDFIKFWPENVPEFQNNRTPCNCIPSCVQINYKVTSVRSTEMNDQNFKKLLITGALNRPEYTLSILEIDFTDLYIQQITHFNAYDIQNFIADIGGLLGLFMGLSVLSILETLTNAISKFKRTENEVETLNATRFVPRNQIQASIRNLRNGNYELERRMFREVLH